MARIIETTPAHRDALVAAIEQIGGAGTFEEVAQRSIDLLYEHFQESIVLARLFATAGYGKLPPVNKRFVDQLAQSAGIAHTLNDRTPVLSLLGTRGENHDWNDRRNSRGHVGIPLASGAFIGAIPMMSRLLRQLGLQLEWIDEWDTKIVAGQGLSRFSGMFYVEDARTEVDKSGRKIIAAQDFVHQYNVRTVFGFGGGYLHAQTFVVLIVFTRDTIPDALVRPFMILINAFKMATLQNRLREEFFVDMAA